MFKASMKGEGSLSISFLVPPFFEPCFSASPPPPPLLLTHLSVVYERASFYSLFLSSPNSASAAAAAALLVFFSLMPPECCLICRCRRRAAQRLRPRCRLPANQEPIRRLPTASIASNFMPQEVSSFRAAHSSSPNSCCGNQFVAARESSDST